LTIKIKHATVYRLRHKIDGMMKTVWGHALRSSGLLHVRVSWARIFQSISRLLEARCGWRTCHHRGGYVEIKLKMDESIRRTASDHDNIALSFSLYYELEIF
jgi:hypothetical protein